MGKLTDLYEQLDAATGLNLIGLPSQQAMEKLLDYIIKMKRKVMELQEELEQVGREL